MDVRELLTDLFGRSVEHVDEAVTGLDPALLTVAPEPGCNPIGWLVWHLARQEDAQVAEATGREQVWMTGDWPARFGQPADPDDHGWGHTPEQVASVRPDSPGALIGYYAAVAARTREVIDGLTPAALEQIVDERWEPPVSLGVRLISIADDAIQHGGQACYVRGLLDRR